MSTHRGPALDTDEMVRRYECGQSSPRIGRDLHCSKTTVLGRLRLAGTPVRERPKSLPHAPAVDLSRVLARTGWPCGWCPSHYGKAHRCNQFCQPARYEIAQIDSDLWRYWAGLERTRQWAAA